jgi:hypothetical protein
VVARASFSRYVCGGARRNLLALRSGTSEDAVLFRFLDGDGIVAGTGSSSPVKSITSNVPEEAVVFFLLDCPGCSSDLVRFLLEGLATLDEEAFKEEVIPERLLVTVTVAMEHVNYRGIISRLCRR